MELNTTSTCSVSRFDDSYVIITPKHCSTPAVRPGNQVQYPMSPTHSSTLKRSTTTSSSQVIDSGVDNSISYGNSTFRTLPRRGRQTIVTEGFPPKPAPPPGVYQYDDSLCKFNTLPTPKKGNVFVWFGFFFRKYPLGEF